MTGYTVHTGSTVKFSSGWDQIFEGTKSSRKSVATGPAKASKKKTSKKKTAVKSVKKTVAKSTKASAAPKNVKRGK